MYNKNKCRACLTEGAKYPIFENIEGDESIYSKLYQCLNENIEDKESYPNKICESCKTIIDAVHNFIKKFKESHKILENMVIIKQEMDIDHEPVSEHQIEIEIIKEEPVSDSDRPDPLEDDWQETPEQNNQDSPNTQINNREKRLLEIRAKIEALKQSKLNQALPNTSNAKTKATATKAKTGVKREIMEENPDDSHEDRKVNIQIQVNLSDDEKKEEERKRKRRERNKRHRENKKNKLAIPVNVDKLEEEKHKNREKARRYRQRRKNSGIPIVAITSEYTRQKNAEKCKRYRDRQRMKCQTNNMYNSQNEFYDAQIACPENNPNADCQKEILQHPKQELAEIKLIDLQT